MRHMTTSDSRGHVKAAIGFTLNDSWLS